MCGIAGFVGKGTHADLTAMAQALVHRGPDGEGFYEDRSKGVYIAHRRLAILDIDGGFQPMWNEDESEALFDVTVTEIRTRDLPDLDDDFAKKVSGGQIETFDALREEMTGRMQASVDWPLFRLNAPIAARPPTTTRGSAPPPAASKAYSAVLPCRETWA